MGRTQAGSSRLQAASDCRSAKAAEWQTLQDPLTPGDMEHNKNE